MLYVILAISFIYRQLQKSKDLHAVNFSEIMEALCGHLAKAYHIDRNSVEVSVDFKELLLDVEKAVPLTLAANELVSNAFQHGFPGSSRGAVHVGFKQEGGDAVLSVSDNGVGLPAGLDLENPQTQGLKVAKILVEQLHGKIVIAEGLETEIQIRFPVEQTRSA